MAECYGQSLDGSSGRAGAIADSDLTRRLVGDVDGATHEQMIEELRGQDGDEGREIVGHRAPIAPAGLAEACHGLRVEAAGGLDGTRREDLIHVVGRRRRKRAPRGRRVGGLLALGDRLPAEIAQRALEQVLLIEVA